MRFASTALLCLAWVTTLGLPVRADEPPLPEALVTAETTFTIPFELDGERTAAQRVRLYVSDDRGASWFGWVDVPADRDAFDFTAPHAGEYWFAIRTLDGAGRPTSDAPNTPAMRVVVVPRRQRAEIVSALEWSALPSGWHGRGVRARTFDLDYSLTEADRGPVRAVELWWTGDGGITWNSYGYDDDHRSPFRVTVDDDGIYGFWMVCETAAGSEPPPRPGNVPQIWVHVDTQPPQLQLATAEIHSGATGNGDELLIRWQWRDARFSDAAVSLHCARSPHGPWTKLADRLPHDGTYRLPLTRLPPATTNNECYLQLVAVDAAGNRQAFTTGDAVRLPTTSTGSTRTTPTSSARAARSYQILR